MNNKNKKHSLDYNHLSKRNDIKFIVMLFYLTLIARFMILAYKWHTLYYNLSIYSIKLLRLFS